MKVNPTPDNNDDKFDPGPSIQEQQTIIERLVMGLILAWVLIGFGLPSFWSCDPAKKGTFGDQFGAVNSLFAGAAFAGVIYTIWLQRQELRAQRKLIHDQKVHEVENLVREKLENVLMSLRSYMHVCGGEAPFNPQAMTIQWLDDYTLSRVKAVSDAEVLTHMYFPHLKPHIDQIMTANALLTDKARTVVSEQKAVLKDVSYASFSMQLHFLHWTYQRVFAYILSNASSIIRSSPFIPRS